MAGVILTTRGWLGAAITWTHADGAETYTVSGDVANAYDVATALVAWLDDPARVWAANVSGVAFTVAADADTGHRLNFLITYTGTFLSVDGPSPFLTFYGDPLDDQIHAEGTLSEMPGLVGWIRIDNSGGIRCRQGSWRYGHAQLAPQRPEVELWLTEAQAHVLSQALRYAAVPRTAYVYDEQESVWRWVTIGEPEWEHPDGDVTLVRVSLPCLGGGAS
jgi:hypothetical protein